MKIVEFVYKKSKMQHVKLGLKENWRQFTLLVIINAFVGGMVGLERSILPRIADIEFHIAAKTAILSFIIVFGVVKAITNFHAGTLADRFGRKKLLVAGWINCHPHSVHSDVSPVIELDSSSKCGIRYQPGSRMVKHSSNEN
jgi:nitrate/nitrite transporter NarK